MSGEFHSSVQDIFIPHEDDPDENKNRPCEKLMHTIKPNKILLGELHHSVEDVDIPDENQINKISLYCDLCNVKVTSTKIMQRHLEGRKHVMKVERQGKTFICELCDVVANSEIQLNIHLNSTKHKNKLLKKDTDNTRSSRNSSGQWIAYFYIIVVCFVVNVLFFKFVCDY